MRDGPQSCLSKGLPMDNHFSLQYCEDRGATAHVHALCAILIFFNLCKASRQSYRSPYYTYDDVQKCMHLELQIFIPS